MIKNVDDIFAENSSAREELLYALDEIGAETAEERAEGEGWTIAQTAMHVATVDAGIIRICAKLLGKAESDGILAENGTIKISDELLGQVNGNETRKLEAPERVLPPPDVSLSDAVNAIHENGKMFEELMPKFQEFSADSGSFPHPYFGDLTAGEWLALSGAHAGRHLNQIRRIRSKLT